MAWSNLQALPFSAVEIKLPIRGSALTLAHLYICVSIFGPQEIAFPKMVASCCRFLCYFCRISRQNQKAMFDHLSYLLENSSVGLGKHW